MTNANPNAAIFRPDAHLQPATRLSFGTSMSAVAALFWLAVRQNCRARRLFILAGLFMLPAIIAVVARYSSGALSNPVTASELEFALIFTLIPHALVPLAALL